MTVAYDIVVIGAGPAGSACAMRSARAGLATALVERTAFDRARVGETLAPSVRPQLRDLGAWEDFLGLGPIPSWGTRSAWGAPEPTAHSHLLSPYGCAWHVDRRAVDASLAEGAVAADAELRTGASVHTCRWDEHRFEVGLSTGERLTAGIVIDGTGRSAHIGRMLGARRIALDRLVAVAATVGRPHLDDEGYLLVETAADGWWYSAPLPCGRFIVMLLTDADLCRRAKFTDPEAWRAVMPSATRQRVGGAPEARPAVHTATSQRLVRVDRSPWLAVGDAALAVDPATGTGVVRALHTAAAASAAVRAYLSDGSTAALGAYEADRDAEWTAYLKQRTEIYAIETRWPGPFWQRRTTAWHVGLRPGKEQSPDRENQHRCGEEGEGQGPGHR